jgi:hypothetical protein
MWDWLTTNRHGPLQTMKNGGGREHLTAADVAD